MANYGALDAVETQNYQSPTLLERLGCNSIFPYIKELATKFAISSGVATFSGMMIILSLTDLISFRNTGNYLIHPWLDIIILVACGCLFIVACFSAWMIGYYFAKITKRYG